MGLVTRGDVWWSELEPTVGVEIRKRRPCLIVSPPEVHDHLRIALIAPMTTKSRPAPYRIPTQFGGRPGFILLEQIRAVDQSRLLRRAGPLDAAELTEVLATLQELFEP